MTKLLKTHRKKNAKNRKHYSSIVITVLLISARFLFWIVRLFYFYTRKNTLFFVGCLLFTISFGFVSFNALFSQMTRHPNTFPEMKFISHSDREKNSILSEKAIKTHAVSHISSTSYSNHLRANSSSSLSENIRKMQKKLAKLGLYDGALDGIEGPKTRHAIALWKQQTTQERQNSTLSNPPTDKIALLIKQNEMEIEKNMPLSKKTAFRVADIMQVQKALQNFGIPEVRPTGIEDQKTTEALKQFQKMFDLPITGKVDRTVLIKMREVGLLN